ncbi:transmission trait enhancer LetE [Legionella sp. MW5194]|uniref:transmission trait enhancer LetE n=1 Tax=Legionella sp. MW5194 TaxID=2662448 RepID=UPI00193CCFBC|nr:transmission trait enhancer LetE [Legionella sp. MW5194]QRN02726.1 transmission trait enhancer LetE [Legionella sp. MW5194]
MNDTSALLPHIKLRFNIEHPNLEDCYAEGYQCALSELGEQENPYRQGTSEHEQWQEGWWAGFYGEEPLYNLDVAPVKNEEEEKSAANDGLFSIHNKSFLVNVLRITGAIAASAFVGYQVLDLVA